MKNQKNKGIKGLVKIQLFDEDKNIIYEEEKENMITNAIYYALGQCITNQQNPSDYIFPLATKALGGILLFDGELDEDVENIHFPMDVHLKGHAGQSQNTSELLRGSLNVSESGRTETGYVNTWDFSTSQANGTIKAVALTSEWAGDNPLRLTRRGNGSHIILDYSYGRMYAFFYDNVSQTVFGYWSNTLRSTHCPSYNLKIMDPRYVTNSYQVLISSLIPTIDNASEYSIPDNFIISYGYDGYLYAITVNRKQQKRGQYNNVWHYGFDNTEGNAEIWMYKWKYDGETFVEEPYSENERRYHYEFLNVRAKGSSPTINTRRYAIINDGYLWLIHQDNLHVYKINMANPSQIALYGPFLSKDESTNLSIDSLYPMKGGGVITTSHLVIYPDGEYFYKSTSYIPDFGYIDDNLFVTGSGNANYNGNNYNYNTPCKEQPALYLGSIMNLGQTIVKTSANSMKIIYTLTDEEYEEEDND